MICSSVNIDIVMFSVSHRDHHCISSEKQSMFLLWTNLAITHKGSLQNPFSPWAYWQVEAAHILGMQFDTDLAIYCIYSSHMWLPKVRREYFIILFKVCCFKGLNFECVHLNTNESTMITASHNNRQRACRKVHKYNI